MIAKITDKKVTLPALKIMRYDKNSTEILFKADRFVGDVDLAETSVYVKFVRSDGQSSKKRLDLTATDALIAFEWVLTIDETSVPGPLKGQISFENGSEFALNTEIFTIDVEDSLTGFEGSIPEGSDLDLSDLVNSADLRTALADYVKAEDIAEYLSVFEDDASFVTEAALSVALTSYVTGSSLSTTLSSYVTNQSLSSALSPYVTSLSLASTLSSYVNDLTLSSTLSSYVTSTALSSTLSSYVTSTSLSSTLSSYVTQAELETALGASGGDYVTEEGLADALEDYIGYDDLTTAMLSYVTVSSLTSTLADYVTSSSLTSTLADYATSSSVTTALNNKLNKKSVIQGSNVPSSITLSPNRLSIYTGTASAAVGLICSSDTWNSGDYGELWIKPNGWSIAARNTSLPIKFFGDDCSNESLSAVVGKMYHIGFYSFNTWIRATVTAVS